MSADADWQSVVYCFPFELNQVSCWSLADVVLADSAFSWQHSKPKHAGKLLGLAAMCMSARSASKPVLR